MATIKYQESQGIPVETTRRTFMKLSASAAAVAASGVGVYSPKAAALNASIAQLLFVDPVTLEYKVFSPCLPPLPEPILVSHYQPCALIEVIKGGGDSALGNPGGGITSKGVDSNDYTSVDVRIWEIPDWAVNIAMGGMGCKMCGVRSARWHNPRMPSPTGFCATATDTAVNTAVSTFNKAIPGCFPKLIYSSEFDPSWSTGCRDIAMAATFGGLICNPLTGGISIFGTEICIGQKWGPLYPRQMASQEDHLSVAAGIAAYRAIHLTSFATGVFPFNGALSVGKLQMTSPHLTVGLRAGSIMLDTMVRAYPVSLDATHAFVWWTPVACCKDWDEIAGACSPSMPCT